MISRRAKIVCTLGPAVDSREGIRGLIEAGMDVARLNFSHGKHAEHGARLEVTGGVDTAPEPADTPAIARDDARAAIRLACALTAGSINPR